MMVLDGIMGAMVAPAISERTTIFAPLQVLALIMSSPGSEDKLRTILQEPWEMGGVIREHVLQQATHVVSFAILIICFVAQVLWHKSCRTWWLQNQHNLIRSEDSVASGHANEALGLVTRTRPDDFGKREDLGKRDLSDDLSHLTKRCA